MELLRSDTIDKFSSMTNAEVYLEAFHRRMMGPLPGSKVRGHYLGNTHRTDVLPYLVNVLSEFQSKEDIRILDVGAGSGEYLLDVLDDIDTTLSVVEPNPLMVDSYMRILSKFNNVRSGPIYKGKVQDLYSSSFGPDWLDKLKPQHIILALHLVYHLTDFGIDKEHTPEKDIIDFVVSMYDKLDDNGVLFIVYSDQEKSIIGQSAAYYYNKMSRTIPKKMRDTWNARKELLEHSEIARILNNKFPMYSTRTTVSRTASKIFGRKIDDLAVMCTMAEISEPDCRPFDISKLFSAMEFIETHGRHFGLTKVKGTLRSGMWSANIPQVVCELRKIPRTYPASK